jgi:hypothetical protein
VAGPSGRDEPVVDRCEGVFRGQQVGTAPLPGVTLVSGPGERPEAQVRQRSEPERRTSVDYGRKRVTLTGHVPEKPFRVAR